VAHLTQDDVADHGSVADQGDQIGRAVDVLMAGVQTADADV
jgi:hypothetical protein